MKITVTGKQLDIGANLRTHVEEALHHLSDKYFSQSVDANVVITRDAYLFKAHISINTGRNMVLQAEADASEAYAAFDAAAGRMQQRLRRYKKRLRDHHADNARQQRADDMVAVQSYVLNLDKMDEQPENDNHESLVLAEMTTDIETLSVSEAVMRLDLGQLPALLFKNSAHGGLNMIYRRADGHVGWVDPANNAALKKSA